MFGARADRNDYRPLYQKVVEFGRNPFWYREGQVPDTIDGRFDMIAAVLTLVLLRLEEEGKETSHASVMIAELFIEDMDGSIRQMGIGDLMVGKHIGKMMGALGGRLSVFRDAIKEKSGFEAPVRKNIFHDAPPSEEAVSTVATRLERFHQSLVGQSKDAVLSGRISLP